MFWIGALAGDFFIALLGGFVILGLIKGWRWFLGGAAVVWVSSRLQTSDLMLIPIFATLVMLLWAASGDGKVARILNTRL